MSSHFTMPKVTVVIPVYNGEKFLPGCLAALTASTYRHYELLVVDDCSNDESATISRERGAVVLKMPRQSGPGAARNLGAQKARGEILFFVDADVVVKPNTLARVATIYLEQPTLAAVFGAPSRRSWMRVSLQTPSPRGSISQETRLSASAANSGL